MCFACLVCFGALDAFWRAGCVLARLVCFGALSFVYFLPVSRLKTLIPLRSPIITSPYPCFRPHATTMRFWCPFCFAFLSLSYVYCYHPVCCMCFSLFCGWNLQLGPKTCNTIFIFSHQESYVCELNLTMTVNYGFLTFVFDTTDIGADLFKHADVTCLESYGDRC